MFNIDYFIATLNENTFFNIKRRMGGPSTKAFPFSGKMNIPDQII